MEKVKSVFIAFLSSGMLLFVSILLAQDQYAPPEPVRCPAEFEPTQTVSICPHPYFDLTKPEEEPIRLLYISMIKEIIDAGADVIITIDNESDKDNLLSYLADPYIEKTDWIILGGEFLDIWTRDLMPQVIYFTPSKQIGLFNAPRLEIYPMPESFILHLGYESFQYMREPLQPYIDAFVNDGGNYTTDGFGTVIMTEDIYFQNRNKKPNPDQVGEGLSRETLDDIFERYLGSPNTIVLDYVNHGSTPHIDMYMKFLDEETILYGTPPGIEPYEHVRTNIENRVNHIRNNYTSAWGRPYKFIQIELPAIESNEEFDSEQYRSSQTLFYTYINSLIVNNHILVPTYGKPEDAAALQVYRDAMPGYTVTSYDCSEPDNYWTKLGGAIHCITHEINREGPVIPAVDIPAIPTNEIILSSAYDYFERFVSKGSITTEAGVSIEPGGFVTAKTDGEVRLQPGFTAKNGSFFRAHIAN